MNVVYYQGFKSQTTKKSYGDSGQIKHVDEFINKHQFQSDIDSNKAFFFAARNAIGTDEDLLTCILPLFYS